MKKVSRIEYCASFEPLQSGMGQDGESKILFPTMKSLDGVNKKNDVNNTASEAPEKNVKTESEKIDFSKVKIEPLFEEW